ncbi:MAG: signal peptidase II [Gammaproteobacteria bacterium]|jgi:signal peptidase II|nr:signal peptidase II [Gammaproteobacteria bacterium]MDP6537220.1 signal peptidase II [Gammaproteobacteria bacterium]MDP6733497.1 signal peptidase II [Gammaproteobacteria bacterium]
MTPKSKNMTGFALIVFAVLLLSQLTGVWVNSNIPLNSTLEINGLIHFTHIRNFGGVFGLAQGMGWVFGLINISLLAAVIAYLWFGKAVQRYEFICFGFVVGGGASNVLDRLIYGSVIDFIDIQHIPFWNYVFNTADMMVHIGIWPMLLLSFMNHPPPANNIPEKLSD